MKKGEGLLLMHPGGNYSLKPAGQLAAYLIDTLKKAFGNIKSFLVGSNLFGSQHLLLSIFEGITFLWVKLLLVGGKWD